MNKMILIKLVPFWFCPDSTVVQWLALLPHSERVLGLIPAEVLSVWSLHGLTLGTLASYHSQKTCM